MPNALISQGIWHSCFNCKISKKIIDGRGVWGYNDNAGVWPLQGGNGYGVDEPPGNGHDPRGYFAPVDPVFAAADGYQPAAAFI